MAVFVLHPSVRSLHSAMHPWPAAPLCREEGIPADEVWVDPQPVTQALLRTSPLVSAALADAVVGALRDGGFLDEVRYLCWCCFAGGKLNVHFGS